MRFWASEALDAAGIDRARLTVSLPTVNPDAVPVREASRRFRWVWARGISAVAMPWGIYLHPDRFARPVEDLGRLIVHELTHIDQWRRLGPLGWARAYVGDYVRGRLRGQRHHAAYRAIGLEEEARAVARRIVG